MESEGDLSLTLDETVEVDHNFADTDSTYDTDYQSELTSLSSSVTAYTYENGRRYHGYKAGKYFIPNDEEEMNREDMKHHWFKLILDNKLHLAPVGPDPGHILDLGTGTGLWCMEMGDLYPSSTIIGTDLSKIQPAWVPPNVSFEIDDWEDDWVYGDDHFDMIHNRFNSTAVSDWPSHITKAKAALKPGGFLELADVRKPPGCDDGTLPADSQHVKFFDLVQEGCQARGRDLTVASKWKDLMKDAGFVNIEERTFKVPMGGWPKDPRLKEAGIFGLESVREGLPAIAMGFFTRVLGWKPIEVEIFLAMVRKELDDKSVHSYLPMHVVWGQKPAKVDPN